MAWCQAYAKSFAGKLSLCSTLWLYKEIHVTDHKLREGSMRVVFYAVLNSE